MRTRIAIRLSSMPPVSASTVTATQSAKTSAYETLRHLLDRNLSDSVRPVPQPLDGPLRSSTCGRVTGQSRGNLMSNDDYTCMLGYLRESRAHLESSLVCVGPGSDNPDPIAYRQILEVLGELTTLHISLDKELA